MSIKTDGLIEGGPFKVTATVPAGFVKNNASGELEFGQAASAWDLIEFKIKTGTGTFDDFDAVLDGDVDEVYQVIWQYITPTTGGFSRGGLNFNGVQPAGSRFVLWSSHTTARAQSLGESWRTWTEFGSTGVAGIYCRAIVYAKSGKIRTGISWASSQRFFSGSLRTFEIHGSQRWDDTTTNITSIGFNAISGGRISRAWLYKIKTT